MSGRPARLVTLVARATVVAVAAWLACGCRDGGTSVPPALENVHAQRLQTTPCEALLPATWVAAKLGHAIRYKETRHDEARFRVLSCEHTTKLAVEVFAFDIGCGGGAKERFRTMVRATERSIRQSEPVGTEGWSSENVYLSWHANAGCYTTVLLSWRRPRILLLRELAAELARFVAPPGAAPR